MSPLWRVLMKQVLVILVVSVLIGLVVNFFHPKGVKISAKRPPLPIATDSVFAEKLPPVSIKDNENDTDENFGGIPIVKFEQLIKLLNDKKAVLIDAREKHEFSAGHIPGAINIPYERYYEFEEQIDQLPKGKWLICYCDGPPCDLGLLLAEELAMRNFQQVAFYEGGVGDWKAHDRELSMRKGEE